MSAMAVIFTCPVRARHFLGVLVWLSTISFKVVIIPREICRSSLPPSSAHHGVTRPVIVLPSFLRSHHIELSMPWDACCCQPSR